jgi:hypothetical protein
MTNPPKESRKDQAFNLPSPHWRNNEFRGNIASFDRQFAVMR